MPKQRAHGTGSIREEDRAGGKKVWIGAVRVGGRQHQKVLGPKRKDGAKDGLRRQDAEKALRAFRVEAEQKVAENAAEAAREAVNEERLSVVGEAYCRTAETKRSRRATTLQEYRLYLRLHLVPYFEDRPLREITVKDVEAFMDFQIEEKGLARSTVSNHVNLLHAIFKRGLRDGIVTFNPVAAAEKHLPDDSNKEIEFLTMEEVEAVVRATTDDDVGRTEALMILTAAMTGLRQGELVALRWKDVDWAAGVIRVRRNFTRNEEAPPKSKKSKRAAPMNNRIATELERHFQRSHYQADDDLVFCHPHSGKHFVASTLLTHFKQACREAGIDRSVRFHDLRHTYGTTTASGGVPIRIISEFMGHASIQTTMIYAHYSPDPTGGRVWVERAFSEAENPVLTALDEG